jgi:hypothetical protein
MVWLSFNTHVLFDLGPITLTVDLRLLALAGYLETKSEQQISTHRIRYHREHIDKA